MRRLCADLRPIHEFYCGPQSSRISGFLVPWNEVHAIQSVAGWSRPGGRQCCRDPGAGGGGGGGPVPLSFVIARVIAGMGSWLPVGCFGEMRWGRLRRVCATIRRVRLMAKLAAETACRVERSREMTL